MSQPSTENTGAVEVVDETHPDPFGGDAKQFEVDKAVDVPRLQSEISRRVGVAVQIVLSYPEGYDTCSQEHPGVLFVHPGSVDARTVTSVLATHRPPDSGQPDPAPSEPQTPSVAQDPALASIVAKLTEGKTLSTADLTKVIGALLGVTPEKPAE